MEKKNISIWSSLNKIQDTKQSMPSAHLHLIEIILSLGSQALDLQESKRKEKEREKAICIILW